MNESELSTLLKDAAPANPVPEDFASIETIILGGRRRHVRRALLLTTVGLAVIVLLVVAGLVLPGLHKPAERSRAAIPSSPQSPFPPPGQASGDIPGLGRPMIELFDPSQDLLALGGGHIVSAAEAASQAKYPLYLPNDAALPAPQVWIDRFHDAEVRYDASLIISYGVWTNGRDPATEYQKMYNDTPTGYLTTISGNPAWVVPAGSPHTVDPRISVVELSIGTTDVTLYGLEPVETLIRYASTLSPAQR